MTLSAGAMACFLCVLSCDPHTHAVSLVLTGSARQQSRAAEFDRAPSSWCDITPASR